MPKLSTLRLVPKLMDGAPLVFEGVKFYVASVLRPAFQQATTKLQEPYGEKWEELPIDQRLDLLMPVYAQFVLVGWDTEGPHALEDDDGNPIPYSVETARSLLTDPLLPDLRSAVLAASRTTATFRERALGNSSTSSGGSASTAKSA